MGVVLGSGYSQVPLASESALAILAMMATTEKIKAQRGERRKPILEGVKDTQMLVNAKRIMESDQNILTDAF